MSTFRSAVLLGVCEGETREPHDGNEIIYGPLAAVVGLAVIVAGLVDEADDVAILHGAIVVLLAVARVITLGGTQSAGLDGYLTVVAGVVMAVGGLPGRDGSS